WPESKGVDVEASLEDVKKKAKIHSLVFMPIEEGKPESPWMMTSRRVENILRRIMRPSEYSATAGVGTWADSIYWVEVVQKTPVGTLISNVGKTMKGRSKKIQAIVEDDLIFPLIRGRNAKKWFSSSEGYILLPVNPETGELISEEDFKVRYPKAYEFFLKFEKELKDRSGYKQLLKKAGKPFYAVLRTKSSLAPYKVGWKHISGKISGKAELSCAVLPKANGKPLVPSHGIIFIPTNSEDEAHYIASVLNSVIARFIVASYGLEVHITTDVPKRIYIPTFDPSNKIHLELAELSKEAHEKASDKYRLLDEIKALKKSLKGTKGEERKRIREKMTALEEELSGIEKELKKIEAKIDKKVARLYGITDEELEEIERLFGVLMGA
ncbi:hypothetical protein, partial [Thermococcus sp.]|uniref:coiled-coil domain-containing protein n=1 Tax=Thermococcus sp. TaxID=35749 RepID=UPI00261D41C0